MARNIASGWGGWVTCCFLKTVIDAQNLFQISLVLQRNAYSAVEEFIYLRKPPYRLEILEERVVCRTPPL